MHRAGSGTTHGVPTGFVLQGQHTGPCCLLQTWGLSPTCRHECKTTRQPAGSRPSLRSWGGGWETLVQVPDNSCPLPPARKNTPSAAPVTAHGGFAATAPIPRDIARRYLRPAARAAATAAVFTRERCVRGENFPPGSHPAFPGAKRWDFPLSRGSDILPGRLQGGACSPQGSPPCGGCRERSRESPARTFFFFFPPLLRENGVM